jgi:hypothetical protein
MSKSTKVERFKKGMFKEGQPINPYNRMLGSQVPNAILQHKELSSTAKLLWGRLAQYAGKDGACFPSILLLAKEIGRSKRQVARGIVELKSMGFLSWDRGKKHESNRYYLLFHSCLEEGWEEPKSKLRDVKNDMSKPKSRDDKYDISRGFRDDMNDTPDMTSMSSDTCHKRHGRHDIKDILRESYKEIHLKESSKENHIISKMAPNGDFVSDLLGHPLGHPSGQVSESSEEEISLNSLIETEYSQPSASWEDYFEGYPSQIKQTLKASDPIPTDPNEDEDTLPDCYGGYDQSSLKCQIECEDWKEGCIAYQNHRREQRRHSMKYSNSA